MSGTFATVTKIQQDNRIFAVKKYAKREGVLPERHFQRELWAFNAFNVSSEEEAKRHHIIHIFKSESIATGYSLTMPYYARTLFSAAQFGDGLFAQSAMYQIAQGLSFIHSRSIIHCDLSPWNIFVDDEGHMVIGDFGCAHSASTLPDKGVDEIGTRHYKAIEHLFGYRCYTAATDVWSLGAIVCHLLLGRPAFEGQSDLEQIGLIVRALGPPPPSVFEEEITHYPDANKLMFFQVSQDQASDSSWDSDSSDDEDVQVPQPSLAELLATARVGPDMATLIQGMLCWSIKHRIGTKEILKYFDK